MKALNILLVLAILLCVQPVYAGELAEKVEFHGFGSWGYGKTDGNSYLVGNEDGEYNNFQFSLATLANPTDNLHINAQFSWNESAKANSTAIDYGFAEWHFADLLNLRIGKVKQPFGIYNEVYDVGTARPFFTLPQSIYGPSGVTCKSYKGLGFTGSFYNADGWGLDYDLYGGQMDLNVNFSLHLDAVLPKYQMAKGGLAMALAAQEQATTTAQAAAQAKAAAEAAGDAAAAAQAQAQYEAYTAGAAQAAAQAQTAQAGVDTIEALPTALNIIVNVRDVVGGRMVFHTPFNLNIGGSAYTGKFTRAKGSDSALSREIFGRLQNKGDTVYGAQWEYFYKMFSLRGEYSWGKLGDLVNGQGAYGEASVSFLKHWQLAARYDWVDYNFTFPGVDTNVLPSLAGQTEWSGGLNYWFNSNFVIKGSYHYIDGNRYALPEEIADVLSGEPLDEITHLVIVGAQFSF